MAICKALRAWLSLVLENKSKGLVIPEYLRFQWRKGKPWYKDVLRYTFNSYHAKIYADFEKLQMKIRYRSGKLLRNKCTNMAGLSKEKVARFWKLVPVLH